MSSEINLVALIVACAVVTYLTRIGGHLLLARFMPLPYRIEAALEAVPVAVISALIAPAFFLGGTAEALSGVVAVVAGLRLSGTWILLLGVLMLVGLRHLGL